MVGETVEGIGATMIMRTGQELINEMVAMSSHQFGEIHNLKIEMAIVELLKTSLSKTTRVSESIHDGDIIDSKRWVMIGE